MAGVNQGSRVRIEKRVPLRDGLGTVHPGGGVEVHAVVVEGGGLVEGVEGVHEE